MLRIAGIIALVAVIGFSMAACDTGGGGNDPVTITLLRNADPWNQPPTYDNWQGFYDIPSSVTGGKITAGDKYTLTYAFTSNVAVTSAGKLSVFLVDNSETADGGQGWFGWNLLSVYNEIKGPIAANTTVSGVITFTATGTGSSTSDNEANRLCFEVDPASSAASQPTLTFTTFSLVKGK